MIGCVAGMVAFAAGGFLMSLGVYAAGLAAYWAAISTAMGMYLGVLGIYTGGLLAYFVGFFMFIFG
jgi:hypothetical protein